MYHSLLRSARARRLSLPLAIVAGTFLLGGCFGGGMHFQNKGNLETAQKLQTGFTAYRADQPSLYSTMTANVAVFAKEEEAVLDRFADNVEAALLTKAPTMTFGQYQERLKRKKEALDALKTEGSDALRADLEKRYQALSDIKDLKATILQAEKEIEAAEANEKKWNETIADLQDAMAKLPTVLQKLADRNTGIDAVKNAISAGDKDTAGLRNRLIGAAEGKLADASGIAIRILQLGLELAELKKEAAELALVSMRERRAVYKDFGTSIRVATALLVQAEGYSKFVENTSVKLSESSAQTVINENRSYRFIRATVENERRGKDPNDIEFKDGRDATDLQNTLHLHIMVPRLAISADSLITRQDGLIRLRLARLRHLDSIAESAIGDRANQALIASGLDALVAYHSGGITDEDIANLIRVAQSVALFIIAA